MRGTTERIMKAAVIVFARKGFTQATTQEIAKEADVAEITLYRKFKTKQNLFVSTIRKTLVRQFETGLMQWAETDDTRMFLGQILHERLEMVSKNEKLIKMLLSESLMGNLSEDINLPVMLYESIKKGLASHFKRVGKGADVETCARQIAGILLSYVIFPSKQPFYQLSPSEKEVLINEYVASLL